MPRIRCLCLQDKGETDIELTEEGKCVAGLEERLNGPLSD